MIRRPMLFLTAGFTTAILIVYYTGISVAIGICAISIGGLLLAKNHSSFSDKRKKITLFLVLPFFLGTVCTYINFFQFEYQTKEYLSLGNNVTTIVGQVTDCEKKVNSAGEKYIEIIVKSHYGKVLVKRFSDSEKNDNKSKDRELNVLAKTAIPGATVEVNGIIQKPNGSRNPGCFDYSLYLKSIGVVATMTASAISVSSEKTTIQGNLFLIKENFIERIKRQTNSDTSEFLKAIMFGDKGELSDDTVEVFQKNGTAHILAVSGLHIGIIYGVILKVWTLLSKLTSGKIGGKRRWSFFGFITVFFICYMVFAGFSPSVVRAVIMVLLHVLARILNLRYDLNNAAFFVADMALLRNPFLIFNAGFQMSFLAVLTMILITPFIKTIYSGLFFTSIAVQIGLGPFILFNFNYLSIIAVLINVPVIALAGIIMPLGLVAMLLEKTLLFGQISWLIDFLCKFMQWLNDVVEVSGITTFNVTSPPIWILAFYYLSILILVTEEGRLAVIRSGKTIVDRVKYIFKVFALIIAASMTFAVFAGDGFDNCNLTFVDVGQGDCICIKADAGILHSEKYYLIDGGGSVNYNVGKQTLRPYLLKNGISHLDGVFVTHLHADHYKGVCELAKEGLVDELYVFAGYEIMEEKICEETGLSPEQIHYLQAGDVFCLKDEELEDIPDSNTFVEVLWPQKAGLAEQVPKEPNPEDENGFCLILKVSIEGKSVLVTGDIDSRLMDELAATRNRYRGMEPLVDSLDCDILKVPHHGSKYSLSDAFFEAVSPEYGVIQVGKNMYGHPAPETIDKYETFVSGGKLEGLYRNDEMGAIGFEIKHGEIKGVRSIY